MKAGTGEPEQTVNGLFNAEIIEIEDEEVHKEADAPKAKGRRKKTGTKEDLNVNQPHEKGIGVPNALGPTTQVSSTKGSAMKLKTQRLFSEDIGTEKKPRDEETMGETSQPIVHCDFKEDHLNRNKKQAVLVRPVEVEPKEKKGLSKYDLIKVTVLIDGHRYVLSRFLISKMLCVCNFKHHDALSIAKEVKKSLIENNELDITQSRLEEVLYENMNQLGYDSFIQRYKMVNEFYQQRIPLIILIAGTKCIGKSFIATTLAERMNISNVLSTSIIETVMETLNIKLNVSENSSIESKFEQKCRLLRRGASTDINKCIIEGKPLVIEGDLVPNLYIEKTENEPKDFKETWFPSDIGSTKWELKSNSLSPEGLSEMSTRLSHYLNDEHIEKPGKQKSVHELFTKLNPKQNLTQMFMVVNPELQEKEQRETEKQREQALRLELGKLDQKNVCILPILLISSRSGIKRFSQGYLAKKPKPITREGRMKKYERTAEEAFKIQSYLVSKYSSYFWIAPVLHGQIEQTIVRTIHLNGKGRKCSGGEGLRGIGLGP